MRFVIALCAAALTCDAASAQYRVANKTSPGYVVVNKTAPCTFCADCKCAAGVCPACPAAGSAKPAGETLTTASGRLIRATPAGYVYADEAAASPGPVSAGIPAAATSGCPNGQCGSAQSFGRQPRFAVPYK